MSDGMTRKRETRLYLHLSLRTNRWRAFRAFFLLEKLRGTEAKRITNGRELDDKGDTNGAARAELRCKALSSRSFSRNELMRAFSVSEASQGIST